MVEYNDKFRRDFSKVKRGATSLQAELEDLERIEMKRKKETLNDNEKILNEKHGVSIEKINFFRECSRLELHKVTIDELVNLMINKNVIKDFPENLEKCKQKVIQNDLFFICYEFSDEYKFQPYLYEWIKFDEKYRIIPFSDIDGLNLFAEHYYCIKEESNIVLRINNNNYISPFFFIDQNKKYKHEFIEKYISAQYINIKPDEFESDGIIFKLPKLDNANRIYVNDTYEEGCYSFFTKKYNDTQIFLLNIFLLLDSVEEYITFINIVWDYKFESASEVFCEFLNEHIFGELKRVEKKMMEMLISTFICSDDFGNKPPIFVF